jgi:hypothetical protein
MALTAAQGTRFLKGAMPTIDESAVNARCRIVVGNALFGGTAAPLGHSRPLIVGQGAWQM